MIKTVRIVGAGLIGTSIGLRLKAAGISVEITDTEPNALKLAQDLIKSEVISDPDLIIVAVPVTSNVDVVIQQLNANPHSKVCDLSSVKSDLLPKVQALSANSKNFFSLHPMAGRELAGGENSRADLFEGRAWIGISSSLIEPSNRAIADLLVLICGGTLYWISAEEHDQVVAAISHLPQILSTALAGTLEEETEEHLNLSGQGLRDFTRLANADANLWSQIFVANQKAITPKLDALIAELQQIRLGLVANDVAMAADFVRKGNIGKLKIPGKHGAKNRDYAYLPIVIDDKPGQLAQIFNECASISINIEDLIIEHSPGQETGLITLALAPVDCQTLSDHLQKLQFKVHPVKNR